MGVFFSLEWLGRGVGFGGWLVGALFVGIVGVGVFWCWIVIARIVALVVIGRGDVFLLAHALAVGCFLAHVDLLARDYFLLALGDWLVIGFGAGLWRGTIGCCCG